MNRVLMTALSVGLLGGCGQMETTAPEAGSLEAIEQETHGAGNALITCRVRCLDGERARPLAPACGVALATANLNAFCAGHGGVRNYSCRLTQRRRHPACVIPGGGGNGDPHMFTYDGLRYEFQPLGEFIAATDRATYNIQVRTEQYGGSRASVQTAAVVDMGDTKVGIYVRESPTLRINGVPAVIPCAGNQVPVNGALCSGRIDFDNGGWVNYDANARKVQVFLQDEVSHLDVYLNGTYINTQFFASEAVSDRTNGIFGTVNASQADDFQTRDGRILIQPMDFATTYKTYGNSWRLGANESAFDYLPGKSTNAFTDLAFPGAPLSPKDLDQADHDAAAQACQLAGVPADQMDACILDAALIGHQTAGDTLKFLNF